MASSATASGPSSSAETRQSRFEQSVALSLNLWPALTLAVQNNWGGPDSADKRDWLAGQVVEQFPPFSSSSSSTSSSQPPSATKTTTSSTTKQNNKTKDEAPDAVDEPDVEYIEELLLQILLDEFEVNIDDESAFDVASEIVRLRAQCAKGQFEDVDRLLARWQGRKGAKVVFTQGQDQDDDTDWDDTDGDDDDDEEMDEAPPLVAAQNNNNNTTNKEKQAPEVDEDGFTKVTRKR